MGRNARRRHDAARPEVQPVGKPIKFEPADYYKLRTRIADADAAVARANALIAVKDALLRELVAKYGIDPAFTRWNANDDTCEFAFS